MEEVDKGCLMTGMGVSVWMFLLVPAYLGSPGQKAIKQLCVCVCACVRACVGVYVLHFFSASPRTTMWSMFSAGNEYAVPATQLPTRYPAEQPNYEHISTSEASDTTIIKSNSKKYFLNKSSYHLASM